MSLAQKLYEGVNINGENKGLITYMRTDSTNLSDEFIQSAKNVIENEFGEKYVYNSVRTFKNKVKIPKKLTRLLDLVILSYNLIVCLALWK